MKKPLKAAEQILLIHIVGAQGLFSTQTWKAFQGLGEKGKVGAILLKQGMLMSSNVSATDLGSK